MIFFKQKLSLATKTPFETASGENQDYSMYNFVVKNRALQPFVSRLTATSLYPYKTRQHNRQIIRSGGFKGGSLGSMEPLFARFVNKLSSSPAS